MTATATRFQPTKPQYSQLRKFDPPWFEIMIWARDKLQAEDVDGELRDLLTEYGLDPDESGVRSEFKGSWFIRYRFAQRAPEIEQDFEVVATSEKSNPKREAIPSDKLGKLEKLKKKLEMSFAILTLGGYVFANLGAVRDLSEKVREALGNKPPVATVPAPKVKHPKHPKHWKHQQVIKVPLSPELLQHDAEKSPEGFERLMSDEIDEYLKDQGISEKGVWIGIPSEHDDLP